MLVTEMLQADKVDLPLIPDAVSIKPGQADPKSEAEGLDGEAKEDEVKKEEDYAIIWN